MTEIRYVNSKGKEVNLMDAKLRIQSGNFHVRNWEAKTTVLRIGAKIEEFQKKPKTYPVTIELRGDLEERKRKLDTLTDLFETDLVNGKPGTLYFGEAYVKCFAIESDTHASDNIGRTELNLNFYCPIPEWITEQTYVLGKKIQDDKFTVYPKRYPYKYSVDSKKDSIYISHYDSSDFLMKAYGPTALVNVTLGKNTYTVNHAVKEGECLIIDSRKTTDISKRCYLLKANGETVNVFNDRDSKSRIFEKIPSGKVSVYYNQNYQVDLTVFIARGEPRWS